MTYYKNMRVEQRGYGNYFVSIPDHEGDNQARLGITTNDSQLIDWLYEGIYEETEEAIQHAETAYDRLTELIYRNL